MSKAVLEGWLVEALEELGGRGTPVELAKIIWRRHEHDLRAMGNLFYTWQYDYRWAAKKLRDKGTIRPVEASERGVWELAR